MEFIKNILNLYPLIGLGIYLFIVLLKRPIIIKWLPVGLVGYTLMWPIMLYLNYKLYKKLKPVLKPLIAWRMIFLREKRMKKGTLR
jgi:hypothetical protein